MWLASHLCTRRLLRLVCALPAFLLAGAGLFASATFYQAYGQGDPPPIASANPCLGNPKAVAAGDWDGDGDLDLAVGTGIVTDPTSHKKFGGELTIVQSDIVDGVWSRHAAWKAAEALDVRDLAWGDWDGDGDLDLAVALWLDASRVYENVDGEMQFDPAHGIGWRAPTAMATAGIAWGDMEGDGDLDLALGNAQQASQVYEQQNGKLMLNVAQNLGWESPLPLDTASVAWGDWDNDGDLDLALGNVGQANQVYEYDGTQLRLDVGQGLGWEAPALDFSFTTSVAWGDWDNDGDLDLMVGNSLSPSALFENDAGGLWLDPTNGYGWEATDFDFTCGVALGDYSGDGRLDLLIANSTLSASKFYRHVGETWEFDFATQEQTALAYHALLADLDHTRLLDAVIGSYAADDLYYWQVGHGKAGTLPLATGQSLTGAGNSAVVAWGDWDGDGDLDLAVGFDNAPSRVYENVQGALKFDPAHGLGWQAPAARNTLSVAWGDWDGDGDLDLALGNNGQPNQVYENHANTLQLNPAQGMGWLAPAAFSTSWVAWADWDGDGDLELAVANRGQPSQVYEYDQARATLRLDTGQGFGWQAPVSHHTNMLSWGDWDGDNDPDLVVAHSDHPVEIYENSGGFLRLDPATGWGWQAPQAAAATSVAWTDWNGDGRLDLTVGNLSQPTQLFEQRDNEMAQVWQSPQAATTSSVIWTDWDGDGDLDLLTGSAIDGITLYRVLHKEGGIEWSGELLEADDTTGIRNLAAGDVDGDGDVDLALGRGGNNLSNLILTNAGPRRVTQLVDNPPNIVVKHPQPSGAPIAYATAKLIKTGTLPIQYTLSDPEGDAVRMVRAFYSINGGGQWFPATPAAGTDIVNLAAAAGGTPHTFVWNAAADLIRSDQVIVRLEAYQGLGGAGPFQWPFVAAQTLPFPLEAAATYLKVVDEAGDARRDALIFVDGQLLTADNTPVTSDRAGFVPVRQPLTGKKLVALAPVQRQTTARAAHDRWLDGSATPWAYQTYLTSLDWGASGVPTGKLGVAGGEQRLVLRQQTPLILFNLVVSVEWDASAAYLAEIESAMRAASNYLYDFSDGQMAFGQVTVYENSEHWADADLQIATKNIVRPHSYIGGIVSTDTAHVMRVGRGWDGNSGNQGAWNKAEGYRTLAHEFGHYALQLYDEYFAFVLDANKRLVGEAETYCTGPENRGTSGDATNASVMDYQYTSSELSARGVPGMWSSLCEETAQWQMHAGESAWETLARVYGDTQTPPRWQIVTPIQRGAVMPGPVALPATLLPFPQVNVVAGGASQPPLALTILDPGGAPFGGALVALYKGDGRVLGQGISDAHGQLMLYGAGAGDTVRVASFDGGLAGRQKVGAVSRLNIQLAPVAAMRAAEAVLQTGPYLRVIAEPGQTTDQISLLVSIENAPKVGAPEMLLSLPGSADTQSVALSYSAAAARYVADAPVSFSASERGTGRLRVFGNEQVDHLQSTYRLHVVQRAEASDLYADDGNLSLHLPPASVSAATAYFIIMPPGGLPGPLPKGYQLVGDLYDITASGALTTLEMPGLLRLHYDELVAGGRTASADLVLHRWDAARRQWRVVPSEVDAEHEAVVAAVGVLGTYALFVAEPKLFLPSIQHTMRDVNR